MSHILKSAGICIIIGAIVVVGVFVTLVHVGFDFRELAEKDRFRLHAIELAREYCNLGPDIYAAGVAASVANGEFTEEQGYVMMEYFYKYCRPLRP